MSWIAHYGKGHDDNPPGRGSGRYPWGSKLVKGKVYRFSNKDEKEIHKGTYVSKTYPDLLQYFNDSINVRLGFKDYDKLYMMKIDSIEPLKVRAANAILEDVVKKYGNKKVNESYQTLKDSGYFSYVSRWTRYNIVKDNKELEDARKYLGSSMNKLIYKDKRNLKEKIFEDYKNQGYDAIVDPEDYIWNYQMPMIILNDKKFSQPISKVIYDKSFSEVSKYADDNDIGSMPLSYYDKKRMKEFMDS